MAFGFSVSWIRTLGNRIRGQIDTDPKHCCNGDRLSSLLGFAFFYLRMDVSRASMLIIFSHILRGHKGEVLTCAWARHQTALLATGAADSKVILWDVRSAHTVVWIQLINTLHQCLLFKLKQIFLDRPEVTSTTWITTM